MSSLVNMYPEWKARLLEELLHTGLRTSLACWPLDAVHNDLRPPRFPVPAGELRTPPHWEGHTGTSLHVEAPPSQLAAMQHPVLRPR